MANISACLSSKTDDWATPQAFFDKLNEEFHFTLDPCADENNHKCSLYFTKEQDGLTKDWGERGFLQSPLRKRNWKLGSLRLRAEPQTEYNGGYAYPGTNGHSIFSRLHL